MTSWYRYIKPKRSRAARASRAKRAGAPSIRTRSPVRIRPVNHIFQDKYSRVIHINGIGIRVCTRNAIAVFFDTENTTILRWEARGVLPEPFYHIGEGDGRIPVYLTSQVLVLRRVVSDLVKDGFISIPWANLPEHIEMLHQGYEAAANRAYKQFEDNKTVDKVDRFGVVFT